MTDLKNEHVPKNLLLLVDSCSFPCSKAEIIASADEQGATESAIEALRALPKDEYETLNALNNDLGLIEEIPAQENLFSSRPADIHQSTQDIRKSAM